MKKQIQPTLGNKGLGLFLFHAVFQHLGTVVTECLSKTDISARLNRQLFFFPWL